MKQNNIKFFIGADHRGFEVKKELIEFLESLGHKVEDKGAFEHNPDDDYPDFGFAVAEAVKSNSNSNSKGILVCGSSIGVCVTANKVDTIFASNPRTVEEAIEDKKHHNPNILCFSADNMTVDLMKEMIKAWLHTDFEGGRHQRRLEKIEKYELE